MVILYLLYQYCIYFFYYWGGISKHLDKSVMSYKSICLRTFWNLNCDHENFLLFFSSLIFILRKLQKFMESPKHGRYMKRQLRYLQRKIHEKCAWGLLRWRQNLVKSTEPERSTPIAARCVIPGYVTVWSVLFSHLWWLKGEDDYCWVPEICFSVEFTVWNIKYVLRWHFVSVCECKYMISEELLNITVHCSTSCTVYFLYLTTGDSRLLADLERIWSTTWEWGHDERDAED